MSISEGAGAVDIRVGDLVTWYEAYDCGTMVKDAGLGLVLKKYIAPEYVMEGMHVQEFVVDRTMYIVHRTKLSDIRTFRDADVAPI